jgi:hypothetical protein
MLQILHKLLVDTPGHLALFLGLSRHDIEALWGRILAMSVQGVAAREEVATAIAKRDPLNGWDSVVSVALELPPALEPRGADNH